MDGKIIRLIPPEEQAYEWARREMEAYFPKPDRIRLKNLDQVVDKPMTHMSFFRKDENNPVILRVYWADTDSVKYSIIVNYDELYREHPELVELFLRNGQYAYEEKRKENPAYIHHVLYGTRHETKPLNR